MRFVINFRVAIVGSVIFALFAIFAGVMLDVALPSLATTLLVGVSLVLWAVVAWLIFDDFTFVPSRGQSSGPTYRRTDTMAR